MVTARNLRDSVVWKEVVIRNMKKSHLRKRKGRLQNLKQRYWMGGMHGVNVFVSVNGVMFS